MQFTDLKDIPTNMHTHTPRCKHAVGEEEEYVEAAIKRGCKVLGFSDHAPYFFTDDHVSRIRMDFNQLEGYVDKINSLKAQYQKDIEIFCGLEMEYLPSTFDRTYDEISKYPLDYFILGQHYLEEDYGYSYSGIETEDEARLRTYVDYIIEGLKKEIFLYVAHPDLINFVGNIDIYKKEIGRLIAELKKRDMPYELNMGGFAEDKWYPNAKTIQIFADAGMDFIIGVDAHSPAEIADTKTYERLRRFAMENGAKHLKHSLVKED